jgi:kynurenine formamidase
MAQQSNAPAGSSRLGPGEDGVSWNLDVPWPQAGSSTVYDLSHSLHPGMAHHPNHPPFSFSLTKQHGDIMYPGGVSASSEMITLGGHVGTHIDALSHVSRDGLVCGELPIVGHQSYTGGMEQLSIDTMPPLLAQAHLVDVPTLLGREVTPDDGVGAEELERWFADRSLPEPGSVVLVRFGWDMHWHDIGTYLGVTTGVPGVTLSGAQWLSARSVLATGADTIAYEKYPPMGQLAMDVHVHLLIEEGVPIMEALHLVELARDERWEFLFMAIPMKLRGGTGSPIRPLAIVAG